jgi:EAL domain-containing protein (putative c-di-GMP-specific phosphodiesterase class I)/CheY-like chemotaxis protein
MSALVVDGDRSVRLDLERLLAAAGFSVVLAANLAEAEARRRERTYDLILIDQRLPDGSGLELAGRSIEAHEDCQFVVMSAQASLESAMMALRLRVADYLLKPLPFAEELHERLRESVEHLHVVRQNRALIAELRHQNARLEDLVVRDGLTGNRVVAYNDGLAADDLQLPTLSVSKDRLLALERSMRARSFDFVYQPIVTTDGLRPYGYEALCRPRDPHMGCVLDAIAAAERTGKMIELGRLLRQAALQPAETLSDGELLFINLHPQELGDPALMLRDGVLRPWASRLVLEISEVVAVEDYDTARRVVRELHDLGFRVALDDLGAGCAGLHALAQLEADFVKLDRSLVRNLQHESRTSRLIKHILEYADSEGITVIAEGVETRAEWEVVRALGCPLVQGFFVGLPAPAFGRAATPKAAGNLP